MKLYHSPAACSQAVLIALREAGFDPEVAKVDIGTHKLEDGSDYFAINPRGYVPLLELDDGTRHTEVAALLQYVGDQSPGTGLMPAFGSRERFAVLQWLTFVSSELHKQFSPWLWHKETAESTRRDVKAKIVARMAELDRVLAERPYLAGKQFTVADAYAFTILSWGPMLGIGMKTYPNLGDYLARIAARPAVQEVLKADGLVKA